MDGCVIQTMPETTNDSNHAQLAACFENYFEKHLALDSLGSSLIRVDGSRLGKDFCRHDFCGRRLRWSRLNRGWSGNICAAEARLFYAAGRRSPCISCSYPVAESRAGDDSANSICASGSISRAWTSGHVKPACLRDIHGSSLGGASRYAVRITETTGLYLLRGTFDGLRRRTSRRKPSSFDCARDYRRTRDRNRVKFFVRNLDFRSGCVFSPWLRQRRRSWQTQRRRRRVNRVQFCGQHGPWKLTLRFVIYRNRSRNEFYRVIILLWRLQNLRMQNRYPHKDSNDDRLRPVAEKELRPRCSPFGQRGKQNGLLRRRAHSRLLLRC